jgi:HlyD family secretion protein
MSKKNTPPDPASVDQLLGEDRPPRWWQRASLWVGVAAVVAAGAGWWYWSASEARKAAPVYITEPLRRGDLTLTVTANGTLQPTRLVNIGSELSGTVKRVLVDINDRIKTGQVLVELDTAKLEDQVVQSRAALASAEAALAQAAASRKEAEAALARYEEVARLSGGKVPSATELDNARAAAERAAANERVAQAGVVQARAALSTAETNLAKASIRSPIDGVVLSRSVDPGNAVAASLQAVTLFTVAEDLTQLKLDVAVDEADVGSVQVGQKASFTVSAYPSRRYPAVIERVAYGSTTTDNVVTYTARLSVDNQDLTLRPGMTATATIIANERKGVLLVPNTALRFTPSGLAAPRNGGADPRAAAGAPASGDGGGILSRLMPRPPRTGATKMAGEDRSARAAGGQRRIWVLRDGQPVPLQVTTGISDGRMTEVSGEGLEEGLPVIVEQRSGAARS